jgi:hypothetical protein
VRRRRVAHPEHMQPERTTPRPWGNMTVPPLFGWENILVLLLVLIVLVAAFFVVTATGPARREREDWQQLLDARSHRSPEPDEPSGERVGGADIGGADVGGRRPPA